MKNFIFALLALLKTVSLALCAGWLAQRFGIPLAWMIGPLLVVGITSMFGVRLQSPYLGRQTGQSTVGLVVGLQLTPPVLLFLWQDFWLIMGAGIVTVLLGIPMAMLLHRLSKEDAKTCYFSAVPGGLSEMAELGARYGAQVEPIAIAQTLRLAIVVITIPPTLGLLGITGQALNAPIYALTLNWPTTILFITIAISTSALFSRLKVSNAWILGGLAVGLCIALIAQKALAIPTLMVNLAQFLLGMGLGVMFKHEFMTKAPRFIRMAAFIVLILIAIAVGLAAIIAQLTPHEFGTLLLAFAPAGVTEMVLTAKELGFEAPLITTIHLARLILIVLFAALLFRFTLGRTPTV